MPWHRVLCTRFRAEAVEAEAIRAVLQDQGLAILFVLALIEGPIVTVIAGALAGAGVFDPLSVLVVAVAGDMAGDLMLYGLGRYCPKLAARLFGPGMTQDMGGLRQVFARRGGWLLILGKLTHVAGFAVILTAGFVRMPLGPFLGFSVAATLPKVMALVAAGWVFGLSFGAGDLGLVLVVLALTGGAAVLYLTWWRRRCV